jgi:hypothetical protein
MYDLVKVEQKMNGFVVIAERAREVDGISDLRRELLVEGNDPKKIGAAILSMFKLPRKSRAKKVEVSA